MQDQAGVNETVAGIAAQGVVPPGIELLWAESTGDPGICIAILDGPADLSHQCFKGAKLTQFDCPTPRYNRDVALQHGTHIASVIFGQHGGPVRGIAPGCRGLIIPVFEDKQGESLAPCSQLDLARAITRAVEQGAHVINISGGQLEPSGESHPMLSNAVGLCARHGILIVASAGNDGCACVHIPAALPSVLVVGAMDPTGAPLKYSNWGESYQDHGILAPGENILVAMPGEGSALRSGTSFATAIVSGVAALLLSIQLKRGIRPDPLVARRAILSSATSCDQQPATDCRLLLGGRLNIVEALTHLNKGEEKQMSDQNKSSGADKIVSDEAAALGIDQQQKDVVAQQAASPQKLISQGLSSSSLSASIVASGQVAPSGATTACGCGAASPPSLVYVLGQIGYDFVSDARRDSFIQQGLASPDDPAQMLAFLAEHPADATALTWILAQEATAIYAIRPAGAYAAQIYERLREFLNSQISEGTERVSIPGYTSGSTALRNGQIVPVIYPELRGMFSWTTKSLVTAAVGEPSGDEEQRGEYESRAEEVANFLERVYYEIRNFGIAPQERAINYAATNAFQVDHIYRDAIRAGMSLDRIEVERSPICRPESDCWDVKLTFFDPSSRLEKARTVYRFTVDVSDIIPITLGKVRRWSVY